MVKNERFAEFMNARFIAWEARIGRKGTVTGFAEALGEQYHQGDVSHWLKGTRVPGIKVLQKLSEIELIGPEVWEAAGYGYLVKDPLYIRTMIALEKLPRPLQERFADQAEKTAREHIEQSRQPQQITFQTAG